MKKITIFLIAMITAISTQAQTAADYYLPLCVGNYTKLHTTSTSDGYCDRSTIYSFIKTENINGVPYFVEEGWEGEYPTGECTDVKNPVFHYLWLRKDDKGNIMWGAEADKKDNGMISLSLDSATIFSTQIALFPNSFLIAGSYISYMQGVDTVISVTATVGSYKNCIQVRSIQRNTATGAASSIIDSYYAYHVGLVRENRTLCLNDGLYDSYIVDYVANTPQIPINITAGGLSAVLTSTVKNTITNLALIGTIDARDFKTMRDSMPALTTVDLSGTTILEYNGTGGTYSTDIIDYPANTTPRMGFYNKKSLISVILPATLTALGRSSFNSCSGLTSINIPSSVTSIGYAEFNGCSSLTSVNIPSGITLIDTWTFGNCTSLKNITIPSSVTSIGDFAFNNIGLTTITLPSAVSTIGYCAFTFDDALTSFQVASDNPYFSSLDGVLFDKSQKKILSYPGGRNSVYQIQDGVNVVDTAAFEGLWVMHNITIPSSVTTLSQEAFYWCQNLKTIDIPASVTSIGGYAFYYCIGLTSITLHSSPVNLSASDSVFKYIDKSACVLYVPIGTKAAYLAAAQWKDFNNIVELTSKTVNVTAGGLYGALTSTELSNTTSLNITGTIDARDFKIMRDNMPVLRDLDISGVSIQSYSGTDGTITTINYYPANTIPLNAFYSNNTNQSKTSLKSVNFPVSLTTIGSAAFNQCGLTSVIIPNGVTTVEDYAFTGCQNLGSVSIPATLSSIGLFSFARLGALPYFQVSADNPYFSAIDGVIFNKNQTTLVCYPLGKIGTGYQIPSSVTVIDKSAFVGSYIPGWSLESVIIPPTVTTLSTSAFYDCENFKSFEIPASVTSIGSSAFYNCKGLTSITVHSTNPIDLNSSSDVFLNVDKVACTLYVPVGSKSAYQSANQWKDFVNIVDMATDVPAVEYTNIKLYPNPCTNGFYIETGEKINAVSVYNLNGIMFLTKQIVGNDFVNISSLPKGMYLVKLITSEGTTLRKIVKK